MNSKIAHVVETTARAWATPRRMGATMSAYLTRDELSDLVGCQPRSLSCMKRWLERNRWPFAINIAGVPLVARDYFDARMNGAPSPAGSYAATEEQEPDFAALEA